MTAVPFKYTAKSPSVTTALEAGDLLLRGWMMRFDETDLEGERWSSTSERLWRSLKAFVDRKGPLAFQHDPSTVGIGQVLECERVEGVGVRVKAVIGYQPPSSPWRHIYESARKGYLPRLSLSGIFKRRHTVSGPVLDDASFVELSICGSSVGRGTTWELIEQVAKRAPEGKAVTAAGTYVDAAFDPELDPLKATISRLEHDALALRLHRTLETFR